MFVEPFAKPEWHAATPAWFRRAARTAARDLAAILILLALGEGAVRLLAPQTRSFIYSDTLTGGHPHLSNALGLREREFPTARPAGETRILCLGNSVTRGTGIAAADAYPKQLERLLGAQNSTRSWFVINAGGEGQSTDRAIAFLEGQALDFDPSVVVLGFSPSMLGQITRRQSKGIPVATADGAPPRRRNDFGAWVRRICLGSYLYCIVDANIRDKLYRWAVLRDRLDVRKGAIFAYAFDAPGVEFQPVEDAYAELAAGLVRLRDTLAQRHIPFLVLGMPSRFEISEMDLDNERGFDLHLARIQPLRRAADICRSLGIDFIDPTPALRAARQEMQTGSEPWDDLYVPLDYTHLNPAGQHILASVLLEAIVSRMND